VGQAAGRKRQADLNGQVDLVAQADRPAEARGVWDRAAVPEDLAVGPGLNPRDPVEDRECQRVRAEVEARSRR
jgi:hypothetical protein